MERLEREADELKQALDFEKSQNEERECHNKELFQTINKLKQEKLVDQHALKTMQNDLETAESEVQLCTNHAKLYQE